MVQIFGQKGLPRLGNGYRVKLGHRVKLIVSGVPETGCLFLVSCGKVVQAFRGVGTAAIFVSKPEIMVTPEIRAALLRFHNEVGASVEYAGLDLDEVRRRFPNNPGRRCCEELSGGNFAR